MIREWQWKADNASARGRSVSVDIFLEILQKLLVVNAPRTATVSTANTVAGKSAVMDSVSV